jgi:heterodisulfide reductase subunit C
MIIDGLFGTERILSALGPVYTVLIFTGDVFALIVLIAIKAFLGRRIFMHIPRFYGVEMKPISKLDANLALTMILLLMVSLLGMNIFYDLMSQRTAASCFPVSHFIAGFIPVLETGTIHFWHELFWWTHIVLIFIFANYLPYSKHFHVFMSVPNVFLSRLEPLGYLSHMPNIEKEVRMMMNPETAFAAAPEGEAAPERFGVKDIEDVSWKTYFDSLACTECGRCTSVCPANMTGKKLSPRKIIMDVRARMKEKSNGLLKHGKTYDDQRALLREFISEEELWACTTCNACARECPVSINHPSIIVDMRRFLVMEEAAAPAALNSMFSYIENNGAPWQYPAEDREIWMNNMN